MDLYRTGKIFELMDFFEEKIVPNMTISRRLDREKMIDIRQEDGRTIKRFNRNFYYQNHEVNLIFCGFLNGFMLGLTE